MTGRASKAYYRGVKSGQEEYAEQVRSLEAKIRRLEVQIATFGHVTGFDLENGARRLRDLEAEVKG